MVVLKAREATRGSSKAVVVDVLGRYSNRPDLGNQLQRVQRLGLATSARPVAQTVRVHAVERRLDEPTRRQLIDEYIGGEPTTVLMERYGLGKGTVLGILRRAGVGMRNQGLNQGDLGRATALYENGLSLARVAEHVDCDAETVRQALKRAGVALRKPWERIQRKAL